MKLEAVLDIRKIRILCSSDCLVMGKIHQFCYVKNMAKNGTDQFCQLRLMDIFVFQ